MDNLARKNKEYTRVHFIDITKERPGNWQYIDVDAFEKHIREDEAAKWIKKRMKERKKARERREAFISTMAAVLAVRVVGILILIFGIKIFTEVSLVLIPIGVMLALCPGHNDISENIDRYLKNKEEKNND